MKSFMQFVTKKVLNKDNSQELLQEILAMLRAQYWFYYNAHWQTKGENFYQQHILFERLYGALPNEIDSLAEKLVSYFGDSAVDASKTMKKSQFWLDKWTRLEFIEGAIESEKDLQRALQEGYTKLKELDDITLGLDDYLMATANAHETNLYLLGSIKR